MRAERETKLTGGLHLSLCTLNCAMAAPARNEAASSSVSSAPAAAAVAAMTTTTVTTATTATTTTTTTTTTTMELPTDASSYTFLGKIGQGAFATVWKAKTASSVLSMSSQSQPSLQQLSSDSSKSQPQQQLQQQYVAVKVLNLDHVDSDLQEIRMEVQLMRLSLHPNILYCHTAFLEQTQLWVVTPFMNKGSSVSCLSQARRSLHIRYKQQKQQQGQSSTATTRKVSLEPHILYILQQTLLGLQYIHDNGQIHRDIKGSNILLNGAGEVKIADFGVSGWLIPQNEKAKTFVGTPCWMAPGELS